MSRLRSSRIEGRIPCWLLLPPPHRAKSRFSPSPAQADFLSLARSPTRQSTSPVSIGVDKG